METEIKNYLGEARLKALHERFKHQGAAVLDDEIMLAAAAAGRREMTPEQRVIFAAIHLMRRAGMRPALQDEAAWQAAAAPKPVAAKTKAKSKP
ncbi:MAG TPA: hypothetical protein PLA50_00310 [Bacteroidia bacterium]|nr:hypothetical protein [Bacteroidia bacterium]